MGINGEDLLKDAGIVAGTATTVITSLWALGRGIFKKGYDYASLLNRITLLEKWKEEQLREYRHLMNEINARRNENEELRKQLSKIGSDLSYVTGKIDQALGRNNNDSRAEHSQQ